jgi:hypothetical protein
MRPNNKRSQDDKSDESKETPRIVWFKPTDKRVPLIAIPIEQAPEDFVTNAATYESKLFVVSISFVVRSVLDPSLLTPDIYRDQSNAGQSPHCIHSVHSSANLV